MVTGLMESLNNTYSWTLGPRARLWEGIPPREYGPADPVPEWSAYYGAPGWNVEARALADRYEKSTFATVGRRYIPQVGVNPWDHVFGPIGANAGIPVSQARYIRSQQGQWSMI